MRLGSALGVIQSKFHAQIAGEHSNDGPLSQPSIIISITVRICLAALNTAGLVSLRRSVRHRFGLTTSHLFVLISMSQFHLPFWLGRTLPNMFALLPGAFNRTARHSTQLTFDFCQSILPMHSFSTMHHMPRNPHSRMFRPQSVSLHLQLWCFDPNCSFFSVHWYSKHWSSSTPPSGRSSKPGLCPVCFRSVRGYDVLAMPLLMKS